jgi:hypothetical protein
MDKQELIKFRPHHFMCTLAFQGKGYSLGFIKNYKKIVARLAADANTPIQVVEYMDDICGPCPNRIDEVVCNDQSKILKLDKGHKEVLDLKIGETLSWKEAKQRIKDKMTPDKFHKICDGCEWKKYGVCLEVLNNHLNI